MTIRNISPADVYIKQIKPTAFPLTQPVTQLTNIYKFGKIKHLLKVGFTQSSSNLFQTNALHEIAFCLSPHSFNLYAWLGRRWEFFADASTSLCISWEKNRVVVFLFQTQNKLICAYISFLLIPRAVAHTDQHNNIVNDTVSLFGNWFPPIDVVCFVNSSGYWVTDHRQVRK